MTDRIAVMRILHIVFAVFLISSLGATLAADTAESQQRKRQAEKKKEEKKPEKPFKADANFVVLQGLDKETARILTFGGRVGQIVQFRTLQIVIRRCQQTPPDQPPEKAAFLQIYDINPTTKKKALVFSGWMFKSKPALSAMDHPVYDVWVKDCR